MVSEEKPRIYMFPRKNVLHFLSIFAHKLYWSDSQEDDYQKPTRHNSQLTHVIHVKSTIIHQYKLCISEFQQELTYSVGMSKTQTSLDITILLWAGIKRNCNIFIVGYAHFCRFSHQLDTLQLMQEKEKKPSRSMFYWLFQRKFPRVYLAQLLYT